VELLSPRRGLDELRRPPWPPELRAEAEGEAEGAGEAPGSSGPGSGHRAREQGRCRAAPAPSPATARRRGRQGRRPEPRAREGGSTGRIRCREGRPNRRGERGNGGGSEEGWERTRARGFGWIKIFWQVGPLDGSWYRGWI
jgi:hypothetical protein